MMGQPLPPPYVPTPADVAEGTDVDFKLVGQEDWHVYKLEDGTTFQLRTILMSVRRLKKFHPDGTPMYVCTWDIKVRATNVPNKLKVPVSIKEEV
jgi:hypothetical protein